MTPEGFIGLAILLLMISYAVIYMGGVVPTEWQTGTNVLLFGLVGLPVIFGLIAIVIAYPPLIILFVIVAATTLKDKK